MAILRERPYVQFNFLVNLGDGNTHGPQAGFQEISGIGMEVTVSQTNEVENGIYIANDLSYWPRHPTTTLGFGQVYQIIGGDSFTVYFMANNYSRPNCDWSKWG